MRKRTVALVGMLLAVVVCAVVYFQSHQKYLMHVQSGSMSMETKKKFWSEGIDCQEVYEVQGYESPETVYKMFTLTQHQYYQLNPGSGMSLKQGTVLCVKGVFDISAKSMTNPWVWPVLMGVVIVGAGAGSVLYQRATRAAART